MTMRPGQKHIFSCRHSGVLPKAYGKSNYFAYAKGKTHWSCKICRLARDRKYNSGNGPAGLLGRMRRLLSMSRINARVDGYRPIDIAAEELVLKWKEQKGKCAWTKQDITLLNARLDHDHKTGRFRGFVTSAANLIEGHLDTLSFLERSQLFAALYPEEVKVARLLIS